MKKKLLVSTILLLVALFSFSCSKSGSSTDVPTTGTTGTGTVSGSLAADAKITLNQTDGTTQTTTTTTTSPDYTFTNVPTGETTISYTSDGVTTSQTVQVNSGQTTEVNPFGSTQELIKSLKGQVYEVTNRGGSTTVADFTSNAIGNAFYTREINVPNRSFEEGFPGITDRYEWFGIRYEGTITAPASGLYEFQTTSDDGSIITINGVKVVNNDGTHSVKTVTGSVVMEAGQKYSIKIEYFQGPKYHIAMVVKVRLPGGTMKLFNMSDF